MKKIHYIKNDIIHARLAKKMAMVNFIIVQNVTQILILKLKQIIILIVTVTVVIFIILIIIIIIIAPSIYHAQ